MMSRTRLRLLLLLLPLVACCAAGCTAPADCNLAGDCVGGVCACDHGFHGAACEMLAMESYRCGAGGLCLTNGTTTWGGSVVTADDGTHHMCVRSGGGNLAASGP